ncbi:MAG: alpha/beta fold hydrolase, partial [Anaerolineales bacterium]
MFGAPRFERDGESFQIQRRKSLALFAYLAVTEKPHSRDSLATLLWPEHDQTEARAGLRRELFRLKRSVGENVLMLEGDLVGLQPEASIYLDVSRYWELVRFSQKHSIEHHQAGVGSTCPECYAALTEAADLYQGDFMAGFSLGDSPEFDDWQFFEGESLRQSLAEILQMLVDWHRQHEDYERAIEYARRWLMLDNLHEDAHRQLIELYARAGQFAAAVRQYQECVRLLREEIGVEPEEETQQLYEIVRSRRLESLPPLQMPSQPQGSPSPRKRSDLKQEIGYCTGYDGTKIAYGVVGEGPYLVKTANWLSHLEQDWNSPVWQHWLTELARDNRLLRYDIRGCGMSDWEVDELSLESFTLDLETVINHIGLGRFPLLGLSGGGPSAINYVVHHPEKVSHLILYGTYARGRKHRGYSRKEVDLGETLLNMMKLGWGQDNPAFRQFFTTLFMPEATGEQMHWFNDLQRISTSPDNAIRLETAFFEQDVSQIVPHVIVPTLILHAREDGIVPYKEGRWLAENIPNAQTFVRCPQRAR